MHRTRVQSGIRLLAAAALLGGVIGPASRAAAQSDRNSREARPAHDTPSQPAHTAGPGSAPSRSRFDREAIRQLMSLPPEERKARVKALLTERMERAERTRQTLADAIEAVDRGDAMESVVPLLLQDGREPRRGGGAGGGPGGPMQPGEGPPGSGPTGADDIDELGPVMTPGMGGAGRPPMSGGPDDQSFDGPITDEDRQIVSEFLASAAPGIGQMMTELRERNPERADQKIRETLPRIRPLMELRKSDRAQYDLRLEDIRHGREAFEATRALVRLRRAGESERTSEQEAAILDRLRSSLEEQYRVRGELLRLDIGRMESELTKRRAELEHRPEARAATIDRMIEKLQTRAQDWMNRHGRESDSPSSGDGRGRRRGEPRSAATEGAPR